MITCFLQYLLLTPTYVNILNVYAFCNTHDITWGTKGDDKAEPGGKVEVTIPTDDADLDAQYEAELRSFQTKWEAPKRNISAQDKHEDYYKGFRSAVVLAWMFCNLALAAIVLNIGGVDHVNIGSSADQDAPQKEKQRATRYLSVVLYSVAFLSGIKFIGACWFLVSRLFRGV
jgi:chitin synthase